VNQICYDHNELITNFCSSFECLQALCPECIDIHYELHTMKRTTPQIESIKSTMSKCQRKIKAAVSSLTDLKGECGAQGGKTSEYVIKTGRQQLESCRQRVNYIIAEYFQSLEAAFIAKASQTPSNSGQLEDIHYQINNTLHELEEINENLAIGDNSLKYIKKSIQLDLPSLIEHFKQRVSVFVGQNQEKPVRIEVDDANLESLRSVLSNIIYVNNQKNVYYDINKVA